jgi:hypothetical protein
MLGTNAAFWVVLGTFTWLGLVDFGVARQSASVIGGMSILNGLLLGLGAWRALRGSRLVDLSVLVLVVVNGVLSATDQMGLADWAAVVWNGVIVALLVVAMWQGAGGPGGTSGDSGQDMA